MTDNYTIEELKALLLKEELESYEPIVKAKEELEKQIKDAIDERGIPELHDIMAGRKTANISDIVKKYDPNQGLPKEFWQRESIYTFKDFALIMHQGLLYSNSYFVMLIILWYIFAF
tara:strand:+ start:645 stop:995 length:351 start_codon:yes stop_codon:yes gene_type:complete